VFLLFLAQPQQYALYQGKMTAQQKRDVIDVTTAAIEQLHQCVLLIYQVLRQLENLVWRKLYEFLVYISVMCTRRQLASCPGPEVGEADPEGLTVSLLVHQRQALAWLRWREQQVPAGGILGNS
jgi:hypothetical protein